MKINNLMFFMKITCLFTEFISLTGHTGDTEKKYLIIFENFVIPACRPAGRSAISVRYNPFILIENCRVHVSRFLENYLLFTTLDTLVHFRHFGHFLHLLFNDGTFLLYHHYRRQFKSIKGDYISRCFNQEDHILPDERDGIWKF